MLWPKQLDIVGAIKKECFDCGEVDPTYINRSVFEKVQSSDKGFAAIEFEHFSVSSRELLASGYSIKI